MARRSWTDQAHRLLHTRGVEPERLASRRSWHGERGGLRVVWWSIAMLLVAGATPRSLGVGQGGWQHRLLPVTAPQMRLTEGLIQDLGVSSEGSSVVAVAADGQEVKLGLDFNTTSVYQRRGVLSSAHLKLGQGIKARHTMPTEGVARAQTIEIIRESRYRVAERGVPWPSGG